ncbi:MAG: carboxypeptidase-like regulatory domain-containing protein, partial [Candidatus Diapherotrites archaeon]|nr:carboxypeptidase-like regulatory domain-containing protein [Candidatus Diapherotrites archaeon]
MKLKDIYFAAEDKYYVFLDWLDKFIPIYKIVDPIDKVFPSFVVLLALLVVMIAGVAVFVLMSHGALESYVRVVDDSGNVLKKVEVTLALDGNTFTASTGDSGILTVSLKSSPTDAKASVSVADFEPILDQPLTLKNGEYAVIRLQALSVAGLPPVTVQFVDSGSLNPIVDRAVTISFSCNQGTTPDPKTTRTGEVVVEPPAGCTELKSRDVTANGYQTARNVPILQGNSEATTIYLVASVVPPAPKGTLNAVVLDDQNKPVKGATVTVMTTTGSTIKTDVSSTLGLAPFSVDAGTYKVQAKMTSQGRVSDAVSVTVPADDSVTVTLNIGAIPNDHKVLYRFLDSNSGEAVDQADATLSLVSSQVVLFSVKTDASGVFEQSVQKINELYALVVDHPNYVLAFISPVTLVKQFDTNAQVYRMTAVRIGADGTPQNFARASISVFDEDHRKVPNATVQLFRSGLDVSLLEKKTGTDGNVLFSRLPAGTYHARVTKDDSNGVSEDFMVNVGDTATVEVQIALARRSVKITVFNALVPATKVNNAAVEVWAFDPGTQATLKVDGGTTNTNGEFRPKPLRVGSIVSFKISRNDYLSYTSAWYTVFAGTGDITLDLGMLKRTDVPTDTHLAMRFSGLLDATGMPLAGILESG